ncbi:c-type cytochrome [Ramlibacter algicola]|uniref:Cytochrome c n=1 Tax=Ramlibacter algicola TaxID=2795217 RepID=A0A934Q4Q0_9BURK|nr:cytochrome c [Ramlibacter algicola]MBK0394214.1 cytochrome c [Ramlibacter algicola]
MRKWAKRAGIALGVMVLLAAAAAVVGVQLADHRMQRVVDVRVQAVAYRADAQAVERGRYLYQSRGCVDCHGANGAGRVFVDDGALRIKGPNISPGPGNVVAAYQPVDWVRTIRHGVKPGGQPLLIMPSEDYNRFTDDDLAALVAYVRSMPPATGTAAELRLPLPVRLAYGFGVLRDAAAKIDHQLPPQAPIAEGVTAQHGAYVANMCLGCHGEQLAGGRIPGAPPDWPAAPALRPGPDSALPRYATAEDLQALFRAGKRKDGSEVKVMPFGSLREMSDTDVRALHLYLQSLPALPG